MENNYDVLVIGGGPSGVAAAISASRENKKVLLVEKNGFLGGMATAALVNPFMNFYSQGKPLVTGIFLEVVEKLKEKKSFGGCGNPLSFETEALKSVLNELCLENNVELLFHSFMFEVETDNNKIKSVSIASKLGKTVITANQYIDCTGDGDLAFFGKEDYKIGREEDGLTQPGTLMFRMGGVTHDAFGAGIEFDVKDGNLPQGRVLFFGLPQKGHVSVNMTRLINLDFTNTYDLTKAEIEGHRQVEKVVEYLKEKVQGFEDSYLIQTGSQVGVRETRRIMGKYLLTKEDVIGCKKFDNPIAKSNYMIDIHSPTGKGTEKREIAIDDWYEIPEDCLIPLKNTNLLVAGRCISATHEAAASLRIMPTCFSIGQAAGKLAARRI